MKILFSNVLKSPSTKLLLIAAALLFVFEANGQMPDAKNNSVVVRIDQPSIMFSFAPNYDVNFLPGYGFGAEYIFQDRVGFDLDVYRRNSDLKDLPDNSNICVTAVFTAVNYLFPGNWYFPQSSCGREFWVVLHTSWLLY